MPITYNEAKDIWELTDPTQQEKASLTQMAITEIIDFFGSEVANRIVNAARSMTGAKNVEIDDGDIPEGSFSTGEAGNA